MTSFGEKIKHRRIELGLSQRQLAILVGLSQMQIWRYEMDKSDPTIKVVAALVQILDVSPEWLLDIDEAPEPKKIDQDEVELVKLYREKPPESKKKLLEIAKVV